MRISIEIHETQGDKIRATPRTEVDGNKAGNCLHRVIKLAIAHMDTIERGVVVTKL